MDFLATASEDPKDVIARVTDVLHYTECSLIYGGEDLTQRDVAGLIWTIGACRETLEALTQTKE